jgi:hypothetical protein
MMATTPVSDEGDDCDYLKLKIIKNMDICPFWRWFLPTQI